MDPSQNESPNKLLFGLLAIVIIGALVGGTIYAKKNESSTPVASTTATQTTQDAEPTTNDTTSSSSQTSTDTTATASSGVYKDGTYTTKTEYFTPGGTESITVNLTISGGTISAASLSQEATQRDSEFYQQSFADSYKSYVVGKSISGLSLSRVAGASLTTQGFNDALDTIRTKAQS